MTSPIIKILVEALGEPAQEVSLAVGEYIIGREADCQLCVDRDGVSRHHARLIITEAGVRIDDLGSSNGTLLDNQSISGPTDLLPGSSVCIGGVVWIRRLSADPETSHLQPEAVKDPCAPSPESTAAKDLFHPSYAFRDEIARGGMGVVIEAHDLNSDRTVAVKRMLAQATSEEAQHRFLLEARVMGHLEHPNIVPMHELGLEPDGTPYYTMKRIRGTDLQKVLNRIKEGDPEILAEYSLRKLLDIFLKVCDAMAFAHSRGIVHRDLKPENIMLGEFGEVLVADWGLAKILPNTSLSFLHEAVEEGTEFVADEISEDGSFKTMEGSVMGTPNYMAPEQAEGNVAAIDARSDIFSLGGILYSILTLRPPVLGKTVREVLENMKTGYIAPPLIYNKVKSAQLIGRGRRAEEEVTLHHCPKQQIPESLSRVAMHALSVDKSARYQSVKLLQRDIEAWQLGYATEAEEANLWRQFRLFVARHQAAALLGLIVFITGATMIGWSLVAESQTREAMAEMRQTSPLIEGELEALIDGGQFERALTRVNSLLLLFPEDPDFLVRRAQIRQSLQRFAGAADDYEAAARVARDAAPLLDAAAFSRELAGAFGTNGLDDLHFDQLVNRLEREGRITEASIHRDKRIARLTEQFEAAKPELRKLIDQRQAILLSAMARDPLLPPVPEPFAHWDFELDGHDRIADFDLVPLYGASIADGALQLDGRRGFANTARHPEALGEFTIEVWAEIDHGENRGETLVAIYGYTPFAVDALAYNLRGEKRWAFQRMGADHVHAVREPAATNNHSGLTQHVVVCGSEGIRIYHNGTNSVFAHDGERTRQTFREYPADKWRFVVGHSGVVGRTGQSPQKAPLNARVEEVRLFRRALAPDEVAALHAANPLSISREALLARLAGAPNERHLQIDDQLEKAGRVAKRLSRLLAFKTSDANLRNYQKLMADAGAPQSAVDSLEFRSGMLTLNLSQQGITAIPWLRGIPVDSLDLSGNPVRDLSPLRGMPLKQLIASQTKITSLAPLAGMKLTRLLLNQCAVSDLSPLRGMPLASLVINSTKVTDLAPLADMPLKEFFASHTEVADISPLRGMPLRWVEFGGCAKLESLAPLKGAPLRIFNSWDTSQITDLSPFAGMQLQRVQLVGLSETVDWSPLTGQPIAALDIPDNKLNDYAFISGMPVRDLVLSGAKGTDFGVLSELPLQKLILRRTAIRDLSVIGSTNLNILDLGSTSVFDLTPLKDRTVSELLLDRCDQIRDVSPLLECRIKRLVVPPKAVNLHVLRDHPTLTHVAWKLRNNNWWETSRWDGQTPKENFWREWDAGRRQP